VKHPIKNSILNAARRSYIPLILLCTVISMAELVLYSRGNSSYLFSPIPKFDGHQFFDLYIWSANLSDCPIPVREITPTNHCGIQYYIFGQPAYPLYLFRLLGLHSRYHAIYGVILGVIPTILFTSIVLRAYLTTQYQYRALLLTSIPTVLFSFQFRYALERGQTDLAIATLYLVACVLFFLTVKVFPHSRAFLIPVVLLSALATATKLYSFSIILSLLLVCVTTLIKVIRYRYGYTEKPSTPKASETVYWLIFLIVLTLCLLINLYNSYLFIKQASFKGLDNAGFGLTILTNAPYTTDLSVSLQSKLVVMTLFFFLTIACILAGRNITRTSFQVFLPDIYLLNNISCLQMLSILSIITIVPVYLVTESFPYKYIFAALALPGLIETSLLLKIKKLLTSSECVKLICIFISLSLYLPYLPFNPSISQHLEWFDHFFLYPAIMGGLTGSVFSILVSADKRLCTTDGKLVNRF